MGVAECMYEANEVFLRGSSSSTTKPREVNLNCQASQQTPFSTGPSCCPGKSLFLKQKNFFHFLFMIEDAEAVVNSSWFLESTGFFFSLRAQQFFFLYYESVLKKIREFKLHLRLSCISRKSR